MTIDEIKNFRQLGSKTAGHPEYGHAAGIETTTGPLGQGIANAVGMAIAERKLRREFGDDLVDHYTYVLAGDGCLMEGISQEAISLAGHLKLNKLIVLWDDNNISIDGPISICRFHRPARPLPGLRLEHDRRSTVMIPTRSPPPSSRPAKSDRPTLIACKTTIGYGAPNKAGTHKVHGSPLGADEIAAARKTLGWDAEPFVVPADVARRLARSPACAARRRARMGGAPRTAADAEKRARVRPPLRRRTAAASVRRSSTTRRSLPKRSRRSRPARRPRTRSRSSTACCRRRSAARPT